jgi:ceramide glucosyltransferase
MPQLIATVLIWLAVLSIGLNLWQWLAAKSFRFGAPARGTRDGSNPGVSILRPLKGCDVETERCLESWFQHAYDGDCEILFGVASEWDPVCDVVRRLINKHPTQKADLVICGPLLGANAKVSSLCHLLDRAEHEVVIISDQDVLVTPDFLSSLVAPLHDKNVGLVNCLYTLGNPVGLPMWIEAVAINSDFWSHVLQGNTIRRMDFALGAAMATTKTRLAQIGGFESLVDYLADDYQLGNRIANTGARVEICSTPVECRSEPQDAEEVWSHQLRWARTVRVCQPLPYFLSILSNATLWPLLAAMGHGPRSIELLVTALVVRVMTAQMNYDQMVGQAGWKAGLLAPAKDLLQVPIWALAFFGNEISWRDQRFHVDRGGRLTPLAWASPDPPVDVTVEPQEN